MHRHGIALGTTFLLLIMVSLGFASAPLNSQSAQLWQNVESTLTGVRAQVSVPMVELLMDEQGSYISIPGFLPDGSPLPSTTNLIIVPNGSGVVAQISAAEFVGTGQYAEELAGTFESVEVGDPIVFKGIRLFPITVFPARVAADGEIMIANDLHLEVEFAGEDNRAPGAEEPVAVSSEMANTIRGMVLNIDEINVNEVAPVGRLLVVIENNATFLARIEPYVQWKRQQGYVVEVDHPTSTTSSSAINTLISNYYNDGHPVPLEYVLLVGDNDGPCDMAAYYDSFSGQTCYSDQYYTLREGDDLIADIAIGRFSVQDGNTELARVVNKTLAYERDVYMTNTSWLTNSCLQAGSSSSGISTIYTNRSIADMLEAHGVDADTLWYTMGGSFPNHIVDTINGGASFLNYRGYLGMSGWSNSYLDDLNNDSRLPIVTILTCGTGDFGSTTTELSEGFFRAGSGGNTFRGGVAAIGTATIHTNTRCNNIIDAGIYEGLTMRNIRSLGWALNLGKFRLYEGYVGTSQESPNIHWFSYWNNLMGDPTLRAWVGVPDEVIVTHDSAINWGQNYLDVDVSHPGDWPDLIWATLADGDEVLSTHRIDASGSIRLMFNPSDVETSMTLTVVGDNVVPYQATITVSTALDYVYVQSTVVDDGVGDDNLANPGETVSLDMTMRNGGSTSVGSQTATVTTSSPYLSIVGGNTFAVPALSSGGSTTVTDAVTVTVSPNTPNGMTPELTVTVGANQISDAQLTVYGFTVGAGTLDVVFGGDGQIDPDETAYMAIPWKNLGDITVSGATGTLTTTTPFITINDGVASYPNVPANGTGSNSGDPFSVTATADAWPGMPIEFKLVIEDEDDGRDSTTYRAYVSDPAANGLTGPDDYGYWALSNIDGGYGVYADYQWLDISTPGNNLGITDTFEDDDDGTVVTLPFVFGYYGELFTRMTVCSNGILSFNANDNYLFRNWPIPNPLGPPAMVAANWDDLVTTGGGVYGYYDVGNGTYTVQWNTQTRYTGASQVFQVILYNPAVWPTESGNGVIKFQYQSFSQELSPYYDNDYCTVGIESPNQDDGIQWLHWAMYGTNTSTISSGTAIVFTDDLSGGTGGVDPEAAITPSEINVPYDGQIVIENVHIANVGAEGNLYWSITEVGNVIESANRRASVGLPAESVDAAQTNAVAIDPDEYQRQKQQEAAAESRTIDLDNLKDNGGGNSTDDFGGPDSYGYSWIDSNEPDGPTYSWHSNYGTALPVGDIVNGNDDDGYFSARSLGFSFEYYGVTYSNVYINTNGFLTFASGQSATGSYSNEVLPSTSAPITPPASMIAPFWDDLDLGQGGTIYFYTNNSDLAVVTYYNIGGYGGNGLYRFQMLLHGDGSIVFQYDAMGTVDITNATIGMQNDGGTIGLTSVYNGTYVEDNLAIRYSMVTTWFEALDTVGLLQPGEFTDARIAFDGDGLPDGIYEGTVNVSTNDQDHPSVDIPVAMYVGTAFQPPIVTDIPNQSIDPGQSFAQISLDDYVSDPNYADNQLTWEATGQVDLTVGIVNRVATITPPSPAWIGSETITFTATNPMMGSGSDAATFTVGSGIITVPVAGGRFELVSFPVTIVDLAVDQLFSTVTDLEIVYADDGGVYWPSHAINTIGDIDQTEGYRFYTDTAQNFVFSGNELNPSTMYSATADQWNWVGHPFTTPIAVNVAFSPIADRLNIVLNDDGDVYWPDLGVNTIGTMTPGDGYQVYVDQNANWAYSGALLAALPTQPMITELPSAPNAPNPSGMPYLVHLTLHEDMRDMDVDVIEILDGQTVVGSGYLLPEREDAIIVAWKGDAESQIAGFGEGSSLDVRVLDGSGLVLETELVGDDLAFGQGSHAELVVRSAALPTEFEVGSGYPNPFNPTITIPYALPQTGNVTFAVYNVLGQQVMSVTKHMDAGRHHFLFNPDKGISSGVYFLQVQYGKQMNRQKIMLLK